MSVAATKLAVTADAESAVPRSLAARADSRKQLVWMGILQTARGPLRCLVADIRSEGARLSQAGEVRAGQMATLVVAGVGNFRGKIVQTDEPGLAIRFAPETVVTDEPMLQASLKDVNRR